MFSCIIDLIKFIFYQITMKFYKKNRHFILGLFAIAIASLFFANQSSTLAAEIPREWEFAQKAGGTSNDY
jgi:hypothetical protein